MLNGGAEVEVSSSVARSCALFFLAVLPGQAANAEKYAVARCFSIDCFVRNHDDGAG